MINYDSPHHALSDRILRSVDATHCAVVATDENSRITDWNDGARALFGVASADAVGRLGDEVVRTEAAGIPPPFADTVRRWREGGRLYPFELHAHAAGRTRRITWIPICLQAPASRGARLVHVIIDHDPERGTGDGLPLTEREVEVLRLVSDGVSTRDMAERLHISRATVRNHIQNILGKLSAHSRLEAVAIARRHGIV